MKAESKAAQRGLWAAAACVALMIGLVPCSSVAQAPPAPPVQVAQPLKKVIAEWDEYTGRFEAAEAVEVRPRVSGFIELVHFRDGQMVKKGDKLFTIDARPYQTAVDAARAEVERAQAQVQLAENEIERARPLLQNKTIPERDFDTRLANLRIAQASLASARATLQNAELNLQWTVVTAPISGRISDRRTDVGNLVAGGTGTPTPTLLTSIVALDPIYFVFEASEADYLKYVRLARNGQRPSGRETANPVQVRLADENDWSRTGKMDFVDNVVNPRAGTIRGRGVFENKDMFLTPGVFGRMRLWGGDREALMIPDSAIQSDQARKIVLTVTPDNAVVPKVVVLGPMTDGLRVIREGLADSDKVIINGQANPFVRPGAKVTPTNAEIKAASPS